MKRNLHSIMLAILLAASTLAMAQVIRNSTPASPGMLLNRKDVQDDLKLTPKVRDQIKAIWEKLLKDSGATPRPGGGFVIQNTGGGAPVNMGEEMNKKALPLLTAQQKTRLDQIRIQLGGPRIALDPAVKDKIKLTADQTAKINKLLADEQEEVTEIVRGAGGRIDQEAMNSMNGIRKKTDAAIDKLITKTQKDKIKELGGAPFKRAS